MVVVALDPDVVIPMPLSCLSENLMSFVVLSFICQLMLSWKNEGLQIVNFIEE